MVIRDSNYIIYLDDANVVQWEKKEKKVRQELICPKCNDKTTKWFIKVCTHKSIHMYSISIKQID